MGASRMRSTVTISNLGVLELDNPYNYKPITSADIKFVGPDSWQTNMMDLHCQAQKDGFKGLQVMLDREKDTTAEDLFHCRIHHIKGSREIIEMASILMVIDEKEGSHIVLKNRVNGVTS